MRLGLFKNVIKMCLQIIYILWKRFAIKLPTKINMPLNQTTPIYIYIYIGLQCKNTHLQIDEFHFFKLRDKFVEKQKL